MGCAASKLEDLPAVALCRDRYKYLDEAVRQSQALADAHIAYLESLRALGPTLHRFFQYYSHCNSHHSRPSSTTSDSASHLQSPVQHTQLESLTRIHHYHHQTPTPVVNSGGSALPSKPPPPPSPISSTWDFFNLFDAYEPLDYTTCHLDPEFPADTTTCHSDSDPTAAADNIVHAIKNNIITGQLEQERQSCRPTTPEKTSHLAPEPEAMTKVHLLFERASESGTEVSKSLHSHHHTISLHQEYGFDQSREGSGMSSQSLSYTLKTLFLWEKKLYDEVKAEERLRVTYEKKSRLLRQYLDNKGSASAQESPKADSIRTTLGNLLTKMKIAIQIVDRISITINKLRDEELWPQIIELIHRLLEMWKAMLECHKCQYQAIAEAGIAFHGKLIIDAAHLETAAQLKLELQNWMLCFSNWIATQKGYVKALNGWLLRCLVYEPQETPQDTGTVVPLSPGRIGAPPVFVICNHWSHAMDRLSEKEVIGAIRGFHTSIDLLLEQHNTNIVEMQQREIANKGGRLGEQLAGEEGRVKNLPTGERRSQMISENNRSINLQWDLKQTLMAMEKFEANAMQAYTELHELIEQVRHEA